MQLTDWIEHNGEERPNLRPGALVLVKIEGIYDEGAEGLAPTNWEFWDEPDFTSSWLRHPDGSDDGSHITHYKVATE